MVGPRLYITEEDLGFGIEEDWGDLGLTDGWDDI